MGSILLHERISVAGLSSLPRSCAVAIDEEVRSSATNASLCDTNHHWPSLAYLNLLERVRVMREKAYDGDTNICQFGYLICGLEFRVWRMNIESVKSKGRKIRSV